MVKILVRPAIVQPLQESHERGDSIDAITPEYGVNPSLTGEDLPEDLSTCVFWSAVGLGAIVKGNPIESVRMPHRTGGFLSLSSVSFAGKCFSGCALHCRYSRSECTRTISPTDRTAEEGPSLELIFKGDALHPTGERCVGNLLWYCKC